MNSKTLIPHANCLLNDIQYFCKHTLFTYRITCILPRAEKLFLTLRKGTERNDSFLLNPVVVTWRYFMDSYIGRIDGMSNIRPFR